jgi:hypothetical protein
MTDTLALITAIIGLISTVIGCVLLFKVQAVHVLVNSNLTKVMARLGIEQDRSAQLKDTMKAGGMDIPPAPGTAEAAEKLQPPGKSLPVNLYR